MDDSFSVRVDKVFGSLTTNSNLTRLWSLTDDEIAKREWDRDAPSRELDSKPCPPPHIDGFFAKTLDDDDESAIRNGIGLDSTLDYQEEEDEFDKVAVHSKKDKHQPTDRFYMRQDVSHYGISADTDYDELPLTLQDIKRDPRANHEAAKLRLKEDAEAALKQGHFGSMPPDPSKDDAHSPKKFKCKEDSDSSIPDYVRNPANYTCYTLHVSDDIDEQSNRKAYMDFLSLVKKRSQLEATDFQKSPTFNPRMKQPAGTFIKHGVEAEQMQVEKKVPLGIVAVESDNAHVSAMEEDESSIAADRARPGSLHKSGRRYRTKAIMMDTDD